MSSSFSTRRKNPCIDHTRVFPNGANLSLNLPLTARKISPRKSAHKLCCVGGLHPLALDRARSAQSRTAARNHTLARGVRVGFGEAARRTVCARFFCPLLRIPRAVHSDPAPPARCRVSAAATASPRVPRPRRRARRSRDSCGAGRPHPAIGVGALTGKAGAPVTGGVDSLENPIRINLLEELRKRPARLRLKRARPAARLPPSGVYSLHRA